MKRSILAAGILGTLGLITVFNAQAVNLPVYLCAKPFDKSLPTTGTSDETVPMWGYAKGSASNPNCTGVDATSPGPRISITDAFDGLAITLSNQLNVPTSLVIPGTIKPKLVLRHPEACSVIGGLVVGDRKVPALRGRYIFTDLCDSRIRRFRPGSGRVKSPGSTGLTVPQISSFGANQRGTVFMTTLEGSLLRLTQ